jgi:hypothetical protein
MSEESKPRSPGCLSRLFSLFLFFSAVGLCVALYFMMQPQDLSDIKGYGASSTTPARDLTTALRNAGERGYPLTLSEADLNAWLKQTLAAKQGGALESEVKLKGVAIRLEKDRAEVIMERTIFGRPFTSSMYLRIEKMETPAGRETLVHRDGGEYFKDLPKLKKGGRLGRLVVPQGVLVLLLPSFGDLKAQFPEEIEQAIEKMARVTIEDEKLELDPREPGEGDLIPPGTY